MLWEHEPQAFSSSPKLSSNISNTRDCFIGISNTEQRVENTTRSGVFLTKFECAFVNKLMVLLGVFGVF